MSTIFYNHLPGTDKLATTVSELTPQVLIEKGVIPKGAAYLVTPGLENEQNDEEKVKYIEVEYTYFDDYEKPRVVLVDYPAVMFSLIEELRGPRNQRLEILDLLQQRAIAKRNDELIDEIEADKQALRDCLDIDVTKYNSLVDFKNYIPDILFIDYKAKFEPKLNA